MVWLMSFSAWSQECNHIISGIIVELETGEPIPYASVFIKEKGRGTVTDEEGTFLLNHMCGDQHVLTVSFMGYKTVEQDLKLNADAEVVIQLHKLSQRLDDIVVSANSLSASKRETQQLSSQHIAEKVNESLANMLESLSGVSTLKNGSGISKPVVQGLYGNRIPILNNGIAQSGQQWGNDHSPEIDPLVANTISVLSGVEAMQYQGRSLGSVILVEPENIKRQNKLNGKVSYYYESNGRGNGVNLQVQNYLPKLAWKVNGTFKKTGDQKAADYYLTNTGVQEANLAVQLEKKLSETWYADAYLSSFNTEIGILRGSHVGNITDLEEALLRDVPFYTQPNFSYHIQSPRQVVNHHMGKLRVKHFMNDERVLSFTYAGQFNERQEFDVRKGGRSDLPAMRLLQTTHFLSAKYASYLFNEWRFNTGLQFNFIDNTNNPETGILPLIPDYYSYETGWFATSTKRINRCQIDVGGRYDYQHQNVVDISSTGAREIMRYTNNFHNFKMGIDTRYHLSSKSDVSAGINYASRNPEVNELYSNGLHQGVGRFIIGNTDLRAEQGVKGTLTFNTALIRNLQLETAIYYQYIDNYIFLNPKGEMRLTIRGAFPIYEYEQTNAQIYGLDFTSHYHISEQLKASVQYSYLHGHNVSDNLPLINMPSNNMSTSLRYHIDKVGAFENLSFEVNQQYVFEQSHLLPEQDYALPPDGYNLMGFKLSMQKQVKQSRLHMYVKVDNLFNVAYRDYMNHMRYFADDLGVSMTTGVSWSF